MRSSRTYVGEAALAASIAAFMAIVSPFGAITYLPGPVRFLYWLGLIVLARLAGFLVDLLPARMRPAADNRLRILLRAAIATPPVFAAIFVVQSAIGYPVPAGFMPELFGCVFVISLGLFAVADLFERAGRVAENHPHDEPAPGRTGELSALDNCLPVGLRGATIEALAAEDHYVRILTDRGDHLALMRFSDAVALMPEHSGVQIHRSWWVATGSVKRVVRENRLARVELSSGGVARASRAGVSELKSRGLMP